MSIVCFVNANSNKKYYSTTYFTRVAIAFVLQENEVFAELFSLLNY